MSTVSTPFKYIFVAEYNDGTMFEQPADDRCKDYDEKAEHNPSAFSDVDQDNLKAFHLVETTGDRKVYSVNLKTGEFAVNGAAFEAHDQLFDPTQHDLRLIFFREVHQDTVISTATGEEVGANYYINRYFIGWQCTDADGKNHQATIGIT